MPIMVPRTTGQKLWIATCVGGAVTTVLAELASLAYLWWGLPVLVLVFARGSDFEAWSDMKQLAALVVTFIAINAAIGVAWYGVYRGGRWVARLGSRSSVSP
jgi:hypothetical protein